MSENTSLLDRSNLSELADPPNAVHADEDAKGRLSSATIASSVLSGLALSACGGSGGVASTAPNASGTDPGLPAPPVSSPPSPPPLASISSAQASRFLAQASMGATRAQIARVQQLGYEGWLNEQFALPSSTSRFDWLVSNGYNADINRNSEAGFDAVAWFKLIASPDTLRQRITFALSEITVAAIDGLIGGGWRAFSAAAYLDLLEANAFGNYRTLLQQVSTSAPMGQYLTFRGNVKYNPVTGALPDENYAREVMQLFSIGLLQLNLDGSNKLANGVAIESYSLDDITGLARVFTGWDFDLDSLKLTTPDFLRRPMVQIPSRHELGAKTFLGMTIPAGTNGVDSLKMALDGIFSHPNVAPFISRQLIQRLVCSNPSPAYIQRVASTFGNDGTGVKGNLKAVIKAILLDSEARDDARISDPNFGKLREPILRFTAWARAFNANSPSGAWGIGNTSDPGTRLGQSPLRSPSVFNFFRPGYVPPNTVIANASLVAPEFQITNESTVIGYVNFMQRAVSVGIGDVAADYSSLLSLADNAQALVDELNLILAASQLSSTTVGLIRNAINSMPSGTLAARNNRIFSALTMVMAAPEFIVQK
ncbi:DUF1800 domain-containing protein [Undibacterium sp. Jales W-56]|uniref:DUF1800 domain-containing protein n=1 Tax=Undibacterium sp. Jales W-56 TaxID=2897325 RepID=UPI0021D1137A|nr:DUF1800 domain-containing protein [Undibacterium sp. Jales W-56]MCU6432726.1 DUF1800 domain-containing protein [Undibacterium sp. Jales W-56]